ncbi:oxidoreductase [Pokkaliibacter sp. CJK22405]|uniref:oxidoreductase n=1 Tax=Pokkaliibacter sp. CJK22405 TaxID=3384615 RepID=UPI00398492AE
MANKTLLITGVSSGFGEALAKAALEAGHNVLGTVRREEDRQRFCALSAKAKGVLLDLGNSEQIIPTVQSFIAEHGPVDVLVNNAGYGHEGVLEESPLSAMKAQFEVNVFAAVAMIQACLPGFRQQGHGHILNITSMGGFITMPGIAYYCGSKFALQGISEVLSDELAPLGIHVTAVMPGSFRTDWAGRSMQRSPRSIADYDGIFDPIREARQQKSGKQNGDPAKAAQAMLSILEEAQPPAQLVLGSDALSLMRKKLTAYETTLEQWQGLSQSTDNPL